MSNIFRDKPIDDVSSFTAVNVLLVHLKLSIAYCQRLQRRYQESSSAGAGCLSLDFWRVGNFVVFDLSINTHVLS
jgi:hypothetical protein